jgi:hypothetical protein
MFRLKQFAINRANCKEIISEFFAYYFLVIRLDDGKLA